MNPADTLNQRLKVLRPAAEACLSDLGRRMFFPQGIPAQAAQAKSARINATIGQLTDGTGHALPLGALSQHIQGLDLSDVFLYTPQGGQRPLRDAWQARLTQPGDAPITSPFVTVGLTHGLSLMADLFTDPDTEVILPDPGWGNYDHIFGARRGARLIRYPVFRDGVFCAEAMAEALAQVRTKAVVVLNFPGNPTGYTPTPEELQPWLDAIEASDKPLVVLSDDAYAGFVYEPGRLQRSPFYALAKMDPDRVLAIKIDGATKELVFFGARVGFVSFAAQGESAEILSEKLKGAARSSVSTAPAVSQAMVTAALKHPHLQAQQQSLLHEVTGRYRALKTALTDAGLPSVPFNSGFFAMIPTHGDPEALRQQLLGQGVGVVSLARHGAIRIAYSSTRAEVLPELVQIIAETMRSSTAVEGK
jgi:aspartate/methionine/tyrosine aminotransferase